MYKSQILLYTLFFNSTPHITFFIQKLLKLNFIPSNYRYNNIMDIIEILRKLTLVGSENRVKFIENLLSENNIQFSLLEYGNGKNIEITILGKNREKEVVFFAHHDISAHTKEGANDNSSSVAILLKIILDKIREPYFTIRIVFTDKEEIIGALLNKYISFENIKNIIHNIGSFNYLKNNCDRSKVIAVFNIEMSGIGDVIFFSKRSGNVICDEKLISDLESIALKENIKTSLINLSNTDIISSYILGIKGIVIGIIPLDDAIKIKSFKEHQPTIWKNNHTIYDLFSLIKEESLLKVLNFIKLIIRNLKEFNLL